MRKRFLCCLVLVAALATTAFACSSEESGDGVPARGVGDAGVVDSSGDDVTTGDAATDGDAREADDPFVVPDLAVVCETNPCVTSIAGGSDSFCAVFQDGRVACWGANDSGQLGADPMNGVVTRPLVVSGISGVTHVGITSDNACARTSDGSVYCWGSADLVRAGVLPDTAEGLPPFGAVPSPTKQDAVPSSSTLSLGSRYACVTTTDGSLSCWGTNEYRELGRGASEPWTMAAPAKASLLGRPVSSVVAGVGRTFALDANGNVMSWGANTAFGSENFMLGRDTSEDPNEKPMLVPLLSGVRSIATTFWHSCAVAGRFVECWGANSNGQLGRGSFEDLAYLPGKSIAGDVADDEMDASTSEHDIPASIATSPLNTCAVFASGRVYCWGNTGVTGILGPSVKPNTIRPVPTRIDGFGGAVVSLAAGSNTMCALLRSGAVECWGTNDRGQLGLGTADSQPHPTPSRVSFSQ
ncbi:regulator of chromosome condensation RCC1 [Labilithrix luteola]|uniref:Regulator of chromosome condensation RCC1 n=1 Tax=Labilithrix luteola TaxID=1391654 RepID=A0A0K1Q224_9BACT|nr:hypothetical protein [Labilithrix luteola]AKU99838.1 regulator of chromosome condensation RCC1 [Labilithrix luteola]